MARKKMNNQEQVNTNLTAPQKIKLYLQSLKELK